MNRHGMTFAGLILAATLSSASAFAQGAIGGPAKQTGIIGGPHGLPSPLVPGQKTGTITVPPNNSTTTNNSMVKKK